VNHDIVMIIYYLWLFNIYEMNPFILILLLSSIMFMLLYVWYVWKQAVGV
jgi:hypothetical protein